MKKTKAFVILLCAIMLCACGKGNAEPETTVSGQETEAVSDAADTENTEETTGSASEHEDWQKFGKAGEVNYDALYDTAGGFYKLDIYLATNFDDKNNEGGTFCWLINHTTSKGGINELEFPDSIEDVPDDWRTNGLSYWKNYLSSNNGMALVYGGDFSFDIESQEKMSINGEDFIREIATVTSDDKTTPSLTKSGKYIAYYYRDSDNSSVIIFGDCSDAQDRFDDVCAVADAIMATYRPKQ